MYIEDKSDQLVGPARIGLVTFSKTGRTIYYQGKSFRNLSGNGIKANYFGVDTGDHYWISGPKRNGEDGLYGYRPTPIDENVRQEYWTLIRRQPEKRNRKTS
jgi:hypothetical protein